MGRHLRTLIVASVLFSATAAILAAPPPPGLRVTKTCPPNAMPGQTFTCVFTIQNRDTAAMVTDLAVENVWQGVTTSGYPCLRGGVAVPFLTPNGTEADNCTGMIEETAPACGSTASTQTDTINAYAFDTAEGMVSGTGTANVLIPPCTPTITPGGPTLTATPTPTITPSPTPTITPTLAPTPMPGMPRWPRFGPGPDCVTPGGPVITQNTQPPTSTSTITPTFTPTPSPTPTSTGTVTVTNTPGTPTLTPTCLPVSGWGPAVPYCVGEVAPCGHACNSGEVQFYTTHILGSGPLSLTLSTSGPANPLTLGGVPPLGPGDTGLWTFSSLTAYCGSYGSLNGGTSSLAPGDLTVTFSSPTTAVTDVSFTSGGKNCPTPMLDCPRFFYGGIGYPGNHNYGAVNGVGTLLNWTITRACGRVDVYTGLVFFYMRP